MPQIGTKNIGTDALNEIMNNNFPNSDAIGILERWFCIDGDMPDFFDYISKLNGKLSDWDKGRVFDIDSEIRWEKDGREFHVVWITDTGGIPDDWDKEPLGPPNRREVLLWGEKIDGKNQWYEKQVPRILEYPVKGIGNRVYVVLNEYRLNDDSVVYRFKEVIAR